MKNEKATPFGERLKKAREDAGFTQEVAARRVGMSQGTLGQLEREGKGSSYTPALAALYRVDAVWLATGKGDPEVRKVDAPPVVIQQDSDSVNFQEIEDLIRLYGAATNSGRKVALEALRTNSRSRRRSERNPTND